MSHFPYSGTTYHLGRSVVCSKRPSRAESMKPCARPFGHLCTLSSFRPCHDRMTTTTLCGPISIKNDATHSKYEDTECVSMPRSPPPPTPTGDWMERVNGLWCYTMLLNIHSFTKRWYRNARLSHYLPKYVRVLTDSQPIDFLELLALYLQPCAVAGR